MASSTGGARPLRRTVAGALIAAAGVAVAPQMLATAPAHAQAVDSDVAAFYRARGGAPLWFSPRSGAAAQQLVQLLATAQADHLNPKRYNVRALQSAVSAAMSGNPAAVQRADAALSSAFVAYVRDLKHDPAVGIIYVDPELRPAPPSPMAILTAAAQAPSLGNYVQQLGWMNPIYGKLRQATAARMYRTPAEYRLLSLNLERARALPSGN